MVDSGALEWEVSYLNLRNRAYRDFLASVDLAESTEAEKNARWERAKLFAAFSLSTGFCGEWEEFDEDIEWLKANTNGREHGEVLFCQVSAWDRTADESVTEETVAVLTQVIALGYREPEVYYERAYANGALNNYGLALKDVDEAIGRTEESNQQLFDLLCLRAEVLIAMGRYADAWQTLARGRKLEAYRKSPCGFYAMDSLMETQDILCHYALQHKFELGTVSDSEQLALRVLAFSQGSDALDDMERNCPGILRSVRELVGEQVWMALAAGTDLSVRINFVGS
jgi:hypothetical protein